MSTKNLERNVVDQIVVQLANIDGSANYNFAIATANIYKEFKLITEVSNYPSISIGAVSFGESIPFVRIRFESPFSIEIFGYVKSEDNPLDEALKLLSDIRTAITIDEHLKSLITNMTFSSEVGVADSFGVVAFVVRGKIEHSF